VAIPAIDCDPDVVLTLGEASHAALAASPGLKGMRLIQFGSHKRLGPAHPGQAPLRVRQCLVLPDAAQRECVTLFEFALACARLRPDLRFRLRPHPSMDVKSLLRRHPQLQDLPPNVSVSTTATLAEEFAQARYCLYRGSSAAVRALAAGIKPFYLSQPGELPADPLFELTDWREIVRDPAEMASRLDAAAGQETAAPASARSFCERCIAPLREHAVDELLAMVQR
jgi:hypothetical protein